MKYALIIGNNRYTDPKLAQLKTPAADSQTLAKTLKDPSIGAFDEVFSLVNKTESQVSRAVSAFLANKKREDLVLIYFSGHGVLDDRGRLFLALKDTDTGLLKSTAISSTFLADEMDSCRSGRQILVLDCCHSGAFERGVKGDDQKAITATTFEGNGYGRVVLTASNSTQYAFEGEQLVKQTELSLFTHFLLEGLQTGKADGNNDGYISLDEWYDYAYAQVLATTPKQIPHKWSYHQQGDLILAKNQLWKKRIVELPPKLLDLLDSPYSTVREVAVKELSVLLGSRDADLAQVARQTLEKLQEDDSRVVSSAATRMLLEVDSQTAKRAAMQRELAERARKEKTEREAVMKAELEKVRRDALEKARGEQRQVRTAHLATLRAKLAKSTDWFKFLVSNRIFWVAGALVIVFLFLAVARMQNTPASSISFAKPSGVYYISDQFGQRKILYFNPVNFQSTILAKMPENAWSPAPDEHGNLFFVAGEGDDIDIYVLHANGSIERITTTNGPANSWSPVPDGGRYLYFVSDRAREVDIYQLDLATGNSKRMTRTEGEASSWSPAPNGRGELYFVSDRAREVDIFLLDLSTGESKRVTTTEGSASSWSPAPDGYGNLYFTSNRSGRAQIHMLNPSGASVQVTPISKGASWAPVLDGNNTLYFTSDRNEEIQIFLKTLSDSAVSEIGPGSTGSPDAAFFGP